MDDQDSDADSWVHIDPADSDDDDAGVIALSSGCTTPDPLSDDDDAEHRALSFSDCDAESLFDLTDAEMDEEEEEADHAAGAAAFGPTRPLSGLFHYAPDGTVTYAAFDPVPSSPGRNGTTNKVLIPDPSFSACGEGVTLLASNRGLVCLRNNVTTAYIVVNPATFTRVLLPPHSCDHAAFGDPAVVLTFEDARTCCADHAGHYHVVVAFPVGDGVYAYESFSSRTWTWTVGAEVDAVEHVIHVSGVGAAGRAFWRTTLGYILCYDPDPARRASRLIPAPLEVQQWTNWELGEMNGTLTVACTDDRVHQVVLCMLHLDVVDPLIPLEEDDGTAGMVYWSLAAYFDGARSLRNRDRVQLLRSQGPEVVMWDPILDLVVATDAEGRTTRTIGPLSLSSGAQYYSEFIPYVESSTGITSVEAGAKCMFAVVDDEA